MKVEKILMMKGQLRRPRPACLKEFTLLKRGNTSEKRKIMGKGAFSPYILGEHFDAYRPKTSRSMQSNSMPLDVCGLKQFSFFFC